MHSSKGIDLVAKDVHKPEPNRFTFKVTFEIDEPTSTVIECFSEPRRKKKAAAEHAAEGALWYIKCHRASGQHPNIYQQTQHPNIYQQDNNMEDVAEPEWSKVIGDESPARAANERLGPSMSTPLTETLMSSVPILDSLMAQIKGRTKDDHKKGGRWKGGMEIAVEKKKRTCKGYGVFGSHGKRTGPQLKLLFQKVESSEYLNMRNKYFPPTCMITYAEYEISNLFTFHM
ncbi:hypothetical protein GIB67_015552 [Kingdonia uniflora]|uniref:DRBM domain-containing protein n=1 Tax=Kingdonia uniflora TaxID=39325 RepID=A0A7J7MPV2_9MAGN|nr:hypothetical protein GIB67_015552 [Kingdonia uniflora]